MIDSVPPALTDAAFGVTSVITRSMLPTFARAAAALSRPPVTVTPAKAGTGSTHPMLGRIASPIGVMEREHDNAGTALARLRAITSAYAVPDDACPTYRGYYGGLERVERELHEHIHLENNVLFPRAIEMEARAVKRR